MCGVCSCFVEDNDQHDTEENHTGKCKRFFVKFFPILEVTSREYFTSINCLYDIIAGISVGIALVPLSTAFAGLAGVSVENGLRTTLIGLTVYAIFGTVKEVFIGPAAFLAIIINDYTNGLNQDFVMLLTFLTGLIQSIVLITRLEYVVNFISLPVAAGFINGASLNIIISLTPGLIGLPPTRGTFVVKLLELFHVISYTRYWSDFPLGITCIIILTVLFILSNIRIKYTCVEKTLKLISASSNAIIILSTTAATGLMDKYSEQPFIVVGTVKGGFRMPALPPFQTSIDNTTYNFKEMIFKLEGGLIAVPLVSALATISLAKSYSKGKVVRTSQEFFAISLSNILGGFLDAMPVTGIIIASAIASTCNIKTTFAGVYSAIISLLTIIFLAPYIYFIPKASLSAVIIFSVTIKIDIKIVYLLWKTDKIGFIIMMITILLTIFRTLSEGLIGGIIISLIQLICTWSRPQISVEEHKVPQSDQTFIELKPDRGMYFPASETLRDIAIKHQDKKLPIVVNCNYFTEIDYTSLQAIKSLSNELSLNGQELIIMTENPKFKEKINIATNVTVCHDENELNDHIKTVKN